MSILSLFGEGFESALLTCSLILLVPGAAVGLAARQSAVWAMTAFSVGVLALSWLRFSARGGGFSNVAVAVALLLATAVLVVPFLGRSASVSASASGSGSTPTLATSIAGLVAGGATAELWRPCVGEHFGQLLNSLPDRGLSGLGLMAVFLVGTLSPLVVVGALQFLAPESWRERLHLIGSVIGGALLALLGLATAVGLHEDLVSQLFLWSVDNV